MIEIEGLDEFVDDLKMVHGVYSKEVKSFMLKEGTKLKRRTLKKAETDVNKKTGNYLKGIKRGKYYRYRVGNVDSIRVYAGTPAFHAHLLEHGHAIVREGRLLGRVKGYHIFKNAADEFEKKYGEDCEGFVDNITSNL